MSSGDCKVTSPLYFPEDRKWQILNETQYNQYWMRIQLFGAENKPWLTCNYRSFWVFTKSAKISLQKLLHYSIAYKQLVLRTNLGLDVIYGLFRVYKTCKSYFNQNCLIQLFPYKQKPNLVIIIWKEQMLNCECQN